MMTLSGSARTPAHRYRRSASKYKPAADAEIDDGVDLVVAWQPVTTSVGGAPMTISHYQLIVERSDQPAHAGFGAETASLHVPASVTSMRVPREFLQPGTDYSFEGLAIADNGNQTIASGEFATH